jgi:hypothetical protein
MRFMFPTPELVIQEGLDCYPVVPLARPVVRGAGDEHPCSDYYCGYAYIVDSDRRHRGERQVGLCSWFCSEKCRIHSECNSVFDTRSNFW